MPRRCARRLASYQPHGASEFVFAGEFAEKRWQLAEVEMALAKDIDDVGEIGPIAA